MHHNQGYQPIDQPNANLPELAVVLAVIDHSQPWTFEDPRRSLESDTVLGDV